MLRPSYKTSHQGISGAIPLFCKHSCEKESENRFKLDFQLLMDCRRGSITRERQNEESTIIDRDE